MARQRWTAADLPDLSGRTAVVTGASAGLGEIIAAELARAGASVTLAVRDVVKGRAAASRMTGRTDVRPLNLADLASVRSFAAGWTGDLDILVNNAAAAIYQPMADFPLRRRMLSFEANVHAPLDPMQAVIPAMRQRGSGWIVNLSSATTRIIPGGPPFDMVEPGPAMGIYGASKAALNRITNAVGAELYGSGIRVNTVQPKAAVLSEGAAYLVGETLRADQIEALEEMVEAVIALCDCPPDLTGRICVSLDLNDELDLTVRALDGSTWNRSEVPV